MRNTLKRAPRGAPAPMRAVRRRSGHRAAVVIMRVATRRGTSRGSGSPEPSSPAAARPAAGAADQQASDLDSDLYQAHALSLVRMAKLLLRDQPSAEDVVQDAFLGLYRAWPGLRDHDHVLPYLRAAVINGSRSVLRSRRRALLRPVQHELPASSAESAAMGAGGQRVIAHWSGLPYPQCWASLDPSGRYLLAQYPVSVPSASDWARPVILDIRSGRVTSIPAPAFYAPLDIAW